MRGGEGGDPARGREEAAPLPPGWPGRTRPFSVSSSSRAETGSGCVSPPYQGALDPACLPGPQSRNFRVLNTGTRIQFTEVALSRFCSRDAETR